MNLGKKRISRCIAAVAATSLLAAACGGSGEESASPATGDDNGSDTPGEEAVDETPYYEGQTIEWILPYGPGGGGSTLMEYIVSEGLSDHIAGNPDIRITYLEGGGGIVGANEFERRAEPDGLTMLMTSSPVIFEALAENSLVEYDFREWITVMSSGQSGLYWTSPDLEAWDPEDLSSIQNVTATSGTTNLLSTQGVHFYLMDKMGADTTVVTGYGTSAEIPISWLQGEIDIASMPPAPFLANYAEEYESGRVVPIMSSGLPEGDQLVRDPVVPDFPSPQELWEAVHGDGALEMPEWELFRALHAISNGAQKGVFVPAGTPDEAVEALIEGFESFFAEPGVDDEMLAQGLPAPVIGEAAQELQSTINNLDPALFAEWITFLTEEYGYEGA